ncbi:hypothetical protein LEP1GSC168_4128 [Leptospira santarosai str. HAI134]|nr:hypothetical protein LEP1GSC168_4128 [Leptospira santarosai str. HAI134]
MNFLNKLTALFSYVFVVKGHNLKITVYRSRSDLKPVIVIKYIVKFGQNSDVTRLFQKSPQTISSFYYFKKDESYYNHSRSFVLH